MFNTKYLAAAIVATALLIFNKPSFGNDKSEFVGIILSQKIPPRLTLDVIQRTSESIKNGKFNFQDTGCYGDFQFGGYATTGEVVLLTSPKSLACRDKCVLLLSADYSDYKEICEQQIFASGELELDIKENLDKNVSHIDKSVQLNGNIRINQLDDFLRNKTQKLTIQDRVQVTEYPLLNTISYPGKYDYRRAHSKGTLPRYIYSASTDLQELREYHNIFSEGRTLSSGMTVTVWQKNILDRNRINADFIPIDKLIAIQSKTPFVAAIVSAPDCPICLQLEGDLKRAGVSYYVAPTALSLNNYKFSEAAYCAEKPGEAWQNLMARRSARATTVSGCEVPFQTLLNFSYAFYNGPKFFPTLPQIVFRDGTVINGYDSQKDFPVFMDKLKHSIIFN